MELVSGALTASGMQQNTYRRRRRSCAVGEFASQAAANAKSPRHHIGGAGASMLTRAGSSSLHPHHRIYRSRSHAAGAGAAGLQEILPPRSRSGSAQRLGRTASAGGHKRSFRSSGGGGGRGGSSKERRLRRDEILRP